MSADPHDSKFQAWLVSLEPRQELVIRFALRQHFPAMRADRANDARVDELMKVLNPDENRLAMILADARMVAKDIEKVIGETPPETKTRERMRQKRPR